MATTAIFRHVRTAILTESYSNSGLTRARRASSLPAGREAAPPLEHERRLLPPAATPLDDADAQGSQDGPPEDADRAGSAAAAAEVLRITPFAACTLEELDILISLTRRLRARPAQRSARKRQPGRRGQALDLRATPLQAMKTDAEVLALAWRQHRMGPRPIVMLLGVSRLMARYSRLYLHFGYALVAARPRTEVVCFGTRLTRITRLLRTHRSARYLEQAAASLLDWNGGTRIAAAVVGLRTMPSAARTLRGAVVVVFSDAVSAATQPTSAATCGCCAGRATRSFG